MQLTFGFDEPPGGLAEIHRRLQQYFGPTGPFLLLDPVSQLIMGFIGTRTRGEASMAAFERLFKRFGDWSDVRDAPADLVHWVIHDVTFAADKAPRLKAALTEISQAHGRLTLSNLENMSDGDALAWLEQLSGVGRKVAAATLNFSTLRRATLVIDTHHLRVLVRLNYVGQRCNYTKAYDRIMPLLPSDWSAADYDEHHQLMKMLGQRICRHGYHACHRCPLRDLCPTGAESPTRH